MKTIILIALTAISFIAKSQTDSSKWIQYYHSDDTDKFYKKPIDSSVRFGGEIGWSCGAIFVEDSIRSNVTYAYSGYYSGDAIGVEGDTIAVIRGLLFLLDEKDKRIEELDDIIQQGVKWLNTVPTLYDQGTAWFKYWKMLKKEGYHKVSK